MKYLRLVVTLCLSAICLLVLVQLRQTRAEAGKDGEHVTTMNRARNASNPATPNPKSPRTQQAKVSDFNGDGIADLAVFQPPIGWFMKLSSAPCTWGGGTRAYFFDVTSPLGGDIPVPGDYSNDLRTDLAVYRSLPATPNTQSLWTFADNLVPPPAVPSPTTSYPFGNTTDVPVMGDFNGDARADYTAVRRNVPLTGQLTWYVQNQVTHTYIYQQAFGSVGDWLVPGDYEGDSKTDITVWRPSNGTWYSLRSSTGVFTAQPWGVIGDVPLLGDFDGDGKDDFAVFRPSNGAWYILNSSTGSFTGALWGISTDIPVPADYNNDGKTDIAVYRPGIATWYIQPCSAQTFLSPNFIPIPSVYVKQT